MTDYFGDDEIDNDDDEAGQLVDMDNEYFRYGDLDDDLPPEYYDDWNPEINVPSWYTCRQCNGMGADPYQTLCMACSSTGIKYFWVYRLLTAWDKLTRFAQSFHRCRECKRFFRSEYGNPALCASCDSWPF